MIIKVYVTHKNIHVLTNVNTYIYTTTYTFNIVSIPKVLAQFQALID